jgi:CYTH domain-containing protein
MVQAMATTRVFLLASSLARLIEKIRDSSRIKEGYFPDHHRELSVRVEGIIGSLTLTARTAAGIQEQTADLPLSHAEALFQLARGSIEYVETIVEIGPTKLAVQQFTSPGPLHIVTVPFSLEQDARQFQPPVWLGSEITTNINYRFRSLALTGLPGIPEIEITNAAVEQLLDDLNIKADFPALPMTTRPSVISPQSQVAPSADPESDDDNLDTEEGLDIEDSVIRELARSLSPRRRNKSDPGTE